MSEADAVSNFEWSGEDYNTGVCMRVALSSRRRHGRLRLIAEHSAGRYARESHAIIADLPAADARRLLAWLRERYPETDTGEPR